VAEYDAVAELYDETRGGEGRGDEYAADLDARLPAGEGPVLEVGVGTGVVALGLTRRGRRVIGLDVSRSMLWRARGRLGPVVALGDAMEMPLADASVAHAVSVWVIHAVSDPASLFAEAARVLRPGGRYLVCTTQRPDTDDVIGQIIVAMSEALEIRGTSVRPRLVTPDRVLEWATPAGFEGSIEPLSRVFTTTVSYELAAIERRAWPTLRELDEETFEQVTRPAIDAMRALPEGEYERRTTTDVVTLTRPSA
jgi:SAM-dependent methyltransferase